MGFDIAIRKLVLGGISGQDFETFRIDACMDLTCSTFRTIDEASFNQGSNRYNCFLKDAHYIQHGSKIGCKFQMTILNASVLRVRFDSESSVHTFSRFMVHYKALFGSSDSLRTDTKERGHQLLKADLWHHVSLVVKRIGKSRISAEWYVNGSTVSGMPTILQTSAENFDLRISGIEGVAVGRADPTHPPPSHDLYNAVNDQEDSIPPRGSETFWGGRIDELRMWNRSLSQSEISSNVYRRCRSRPPNNSRIDEYPDVAMENIRMSEALVCFGFDDLPLNGEGFVDSGIHPPLSAVPIVGDYYAPWCLTIDDNAMLIDKNSHRNDLNGQAWGFCEGRPRLPGLSYDYIEEELALSALRLDLENLDGCAREDLVFIENKAQRFARIRLN